MSIDAIRQSQQLSALPPEKTGAGGAARGRDTMAPGGDAAKTAGNGDADEGLSFWDVLDVINPLQHIPIVSTIYREITGDQIGDAARIAGGALFGGPIGLAMAGVNFAVKAFTGKNIDEQVMAMMGLDDTVTAEGTAVAEAAKDVDTAAARAPAPGGPATVEEVPLEAQAAVSSPTDETTEAARQDAATTAPAQPVPRVTGKWFSLDRAERHDPFMPLGAQSKLEHALRSRQAPSKAEPAVAPSGKSPEKPSETAPQETATGKTAPQRAEQRQAGTVEVNPLGRPTAAYLPLGLLQGVPEPPPSTGQALQPPAEAVRRAARAQGLDPTRYPALAGATTGQLNTGASTRVNPGANPGASPRAGDAASPHATAQAGNAVTVPAWFDTAMQKALTAYEKTGRLSGDPQGSDAWERPDS